LAFAKNKEISSLTLYSLVLLVFYAHLIFLSVLSLKEYIESYPVRVNADHVVFTYHPTEDGAYVIAVNHSEEDKDPGFVFAPGCEVEQVIYGDMGQIKAYDAIVLKVRVK
jgi:hypothetical protein